MWMLARFQNLGEEGDQYMKLTISIGDKIPEGFQDSLGALE